MKLKEISPLYLDVVGDNLWVDVSEQNDPILQNLLTNDDIDESEIKY